MTRIVLMCLRNFWRVPGLWFKLCHYAKHTDKYSRQELHDHVHKIMTYAVKAGNLDFQVYGKEHLPEILEDLGRPENPIPMWEE